MDNSDIKNLILKRIENGKRTLDKLSSSLDIEKNVLKSILNEMKEDLLISEKNGIYSNCLDNNHKIGTLSITSKGMGIVFADGISYFIDKDYLNNALNNDTVLIEITDKLRRRAIIKDKKNETKTMVGTTYIKNKKMFVELDDPLFKGKIVLDKAPDFLKENEKILVSFFRDKNKVKFKGNVEEILGNKNDVGVDILSMIKESGIDDKISEEEILALASIKNSVDETDIIGRTDLREDKTFTIDGTDSKDFDDAISIKRTNNNGYLLRVSISDVDNYVSDGSILDKIARQKVTTAYLCDRTIPMIPKTLSEGICSLNPFNDRLTLTYEIEYDHNGDIIRYDIYTSVVNSKKRMTYEGVEEVLDNKPSDDYKDFIDEINLAYELSQKLYNNRLREGYIDIKRNEYKLIYNYEEGKIEKIVPSESLKSMKIIEEFMIATNKCAGLFASNNNIPIIKRVQDEVDRNVLEENLSILVKLGYKEFDFPQDSPCHDMISKVLTYYQFDENIDTISRIIVNKNRAYYTSDYLGHASLNDDYYAHLTAPIRRYPDLYSSRQIKKFLENKTQENDLNNEFFVYLNNKLDDVDHCVKRAEGLKIAEYHLDSNNIFTAKVININNRFMTIMLEDFTTSVIFLKTLDGYRFDENTYSYIKNKNETISIGNIIEVGIIDIDKYYGRTNFKLERKIR